jgi:hypothetical protein
MLRLQTDAKGNRSPKRVADENNGTKTLFPDEGAHYCSLVFNGIGSVPWFCG